MQIAKPTPLGNLHYLATEPAAEATAARRAAAAVAPGETAATTSRSCVISNYSGN